MICFVEYGSLLGGCTLAVTRQEESGYVPLGAASTTICSVEFGTSEGVCTHAMKRKEESLVMFL